MKKTTATPNVRMPISKARGQLFALADYVRTNDVPVVLEQRGGLEAVALVRESRLAYLEATVAAFSAPKAAGPLTLRGSLSTSLTDGEVDTALSSLRRAWAPR